MADPVTQALRVYEACGVKAQHTDQKIEDYVEQMVRLNASRGDLHSIFCNLPVADIDSMLGIVKGTRDLKFTPEQKQIIGEIVCNAIVEHFTLEGETNIRERGE
jgi:hypothetical protein